MRAALAAPAGTASAVIPAEVSRDLGRDPRALVLFQHFARYANRDGLAWPSLERTLRELGWSERTYYYAAARLEASGHARRVAGGHRGMVARWIIPAFRQSRQAGLDAVRAARHLARRHTRSLGRVLRDAAPSLGIDSLQRVADGTTLRDNSPAEGLPTVGGRHAYAPDSVGLCSDCGLPRGNRRHK